MLIKHSYLLEYTHIIKACVRGDRNSQTELYKLFAPKMFALCLRYAKNREEAEDIIQDGFVQVFRSLKSFKFSGSFEGWVKKIMVYAAIHHYRSSLRLPPVISIDTVYNNEPEREHILSNLGRKELLKLIQNLPASYRMVFNLYVFEGMKHREIAALLNISEGTSKSNFFDAKKILQREITHSLKIAKPKY